MNNYQGIWATTNNETYEFEVIPRKTNSAYEYNKDNSLKFKGRPANTREVKLYRLQQGVNGNEDTFYIYSTNLPFEVKPGDQIKCLGQIQTVISVGYYYDVNGIVNASIFNEEYVAARCPKGIAVG